MQGLIQEIETGQWSPGDFFTTEEELQEGLGVSRATVRKALEQLMDDGLLERITGKGTFIARPPVKITLPHLISFSEEIQAWGMKPSTKVIRVERVHRSEEHTSELQSRENLVCRLLLEKKKKKPEHDGKPAL